MISIEIAKTYAWGINKKQKLRYVPAASQFQRQAAARCLCNPDVDNKTWKELHIYIDAYMKTSKHTHRRL